MKISLFVRFVIIVTVIVLILGIVGFYTIQKYGLNRHAVYLRKIKKGRFGPKIWQISMVLENTQQFLSRDFLFKCQ
jgi:hypothetical protein